MNVRMIQAAIKMFRQETDRKIEENSNYAFRYYFTVKLINREHLKYAWNVYCVITNHKQDLQPQKPKKTDEFPSVMKQICFVHQ